MTMKPMMRRLRYDFLVTMTFHDTSFSLSMLYCCLICSNSRTAKVLSGSSLSRWSFWMTARASS
jgi:hypothetical protein